jgi:nucleoside-diphosphate-sugar epimerase
MANDVPVSVVTGAGGFVGQALVRRLLAEGDRVRAIVLPRDPAAAALHAQGGGPGRLQVIEADVTDSATMAPALAGAQRVFHTAALVHAWAPRAAFRRVNVDGTRHVAEAAHRHGVLRFVHVSTTDVFGLPAGDDVITEATPYRAWHEPYADTKIEAEQWLWQCHRATGLAVSVIYPGWVYGPGDRAFFPALAAAIADGSMLFWARDIRLAWVYIDNLVDACLLASAHPAAVGQGYLVYDTLEGPTFEDVCARIAATIGAPAPTRRVPYAVALAAAHGLQTLWRVLRRPIPPPLRTVDVKAFGLQWRFSNAKVRRELGWTPRVSVEDGMARALAALRNEQPATSDEQ